MCDAAGGGAALRQSTVKQRNARFLKKMVAVAGIALVVGLGFYTSIYFYVKNGDAWIFGQQAIASSPEVAKKYGNVRAASMSFTGMSYSLRGGTEKVLIKSHVEGERLSGPVYLRLHKDEGSDWVLDAIATGATMSPPTVPGVGQPPSAQ